MKIKAGILFFLSLFLAGCCQDSIPETTAVSTTEPAITVCATLPETQPATIPTTQPTEPPSLPEQILNGMTLEEKVGQMLLVRCPEESAAEDIDTYHLGGYILFGRDFEQETADSATAKIMSYQQSAEIPLFIAVDEEGGTVNRVSCYPQYSEERFYSPRYLYSQGGLELIQSTEVEKCQLLSSLGINVNMAPVCDVTTDENAFMYYRSLGESPELTGEFVAGNVTVMAEHRIGSVLKHFPGYGNNTDTHSGIAVDSRSLESLETKDLIPFQAGIDAGCGAVMVSHTIVECLDPVLPASLSPTVHTYLRETMCFEGVIVTDDLVMEAITDLYGDEEAAVLAVLAGNDLLCCTNYQTQYHAILEAAETGRIPLSAINDAVLRILRWKEDLGLLEQVSITN